MEFPCATLERMAVRFDILAINAAMPHLEKSRAEVIRQAISAYEQLSERCVMDATAASLEIGQLRARLAALEPKP